jgi:hypothetical protein
MWPVTHPAIDASHFWYAQPARFDGRFFDGFSHGTGYGAGYYPGHGCEAAWWAPRPMYDLWGAAATYRAPLPPSAPPVPSAPAPTPPPVLSATTKTIRKDGTIRVEHNMPNVFREKVENRLPGLQTLTGARVYSLGAGRSVHTFLLAISGTKESVVLAETKLDEVRVVGVVWGGWFGGWFGGVVWGVF